MKQNTEDATFWANLPDVVGNPTAERLKEISRDSRDELTEQGAAAVEYLNLDGLKDWIADRTLEEMFTGMAAVSVSYILNRIRTKLKQRRVRSSLSGIQRLDSETADKLFDTMNDKLILSKLLDRVDTSDKSAVKAVLDYASGAAVDAEELWDRVERNSDSDIAKALRVFNGLGNSVALDDPKKGITI